MEPTTESSGYWPPQDQAPAPGWWRASDGRWYPPSQSPGEWAPPAPPAFPYGTAAPGGTPYYPSSGPPPSWAPLWAEPQSSGNGFSITAIVMGAIALLFVPPLFGVLGLIFGGVGLHRKEKLAPLGMIIASLGLVLGFVLGAIIVGVFHR